MRYDDGLLTPDDLTEEKKKEYIEKIEAFLKEHPDVKFNGTWVDSDGWGYDEWEAPDIETVEKALAEAGMVCDEILEVEKVMP